MAFKPIEILINAKDSASGVFDKLKSKVAGVAAAIAAYLSVSAFVGMVRGAADFEAALSGVQAATGATAEEMVQLRKAAEGLDDFGGAEAALALENLGKAGLSASDAIAALKPSADLAKAGQIGLGQASEALTQVIFGLGLSFKDSARVADVLAAGANATKTSVAGLTQGLSYAAPVANSLGLSLEFTVAMLGQFAQGGIDASRAGTALNSIMSQFLDPASKFRNELAAAGISTGNFEQALRQLAVAGPAGAKAINAVGLESGPALRAALNLGVGALDDLVGKLKNAEGSAAATAAVMRNNLNGSLASLGKAWEYLTNVLGTPVLPVLKQGVDELAAAFRGAVADGTVQKFGEAIATAFTNGLKFVREFLANFNFTEAIARLQKFADDANTNLKLVAEYAGSAASTIKLSFAVMSAGANSVMTGIYGIAASYTEASIRIIQFAADASDALAKISFGDTKERLKNEAEEMRSVLGGLGAVRDEFLRKTQESLDLTLQAAKAAQEGFAGIKVPVQEAGDAVDEWQKSVAAAKAEQESANDVLRKSELAYRKQVDAELALARATEEHEAKLAELNRQYEEFKSSGNINEAIKVADEFQKVLRQGTLTAEEYKKKLDEAAKAVGDAFIQLGITSTASMKGQADAAKTSYDTIRSAGTSTAEDISAAFGKAAELAIAANKGIAPSWVTAEAAARGYKIVVDEAGKSHLELINKAGPGLDRLAKGWNVSREAIQAHEDAMDKLLMKYTLSADYTERQIALLEREAAAAEKAAEAYRKKWNMDKEGYSLNTAGERINQGESQQQVDEDVARRYGEQNVDNADAQRARQLAVLLGMIADGGGQITDAGTSKNIADMRRELQALEVKLLNTAPATPEGGTTASAPNTPAGGASRGGGSTPRTSGGSGMGGSTSTVVFNLKSGPQAIQDMTPGDVNVINSVIQELSRGKGTAR